MLLMSKKTERPPAPDDVPEVQEAKARSLAATRAVEDAKARYEHLQAACYWRGEGEEDEVKAAKVVRKAAWKAEDQAKAEHERLLEEARQPLHAYYQQAYQQAMLGLLQKLDDAVPAARIVEALFREANEHGLHLDPRPPKWFYNDGGDVAHDKFRDQLCAKGWR